MHIAYMWHDRTAARATTEIGLCLLRHVKSMSTSASRLILYKDSCRGQNRTVHQLCLYLYIVGNPNLKFDVIDHKCARSFLSINGRDSGIIEQAKQPHLHVYTPQEWYDLEFTMLYQPLLL